MDSATQKSHVSIFIQEVHQPCRNVAWVVADSGGRATGRYPLSKFVGAEFVKGGSWLGSPQAVRTPPGWLAMHA